MPARDHVCHSPSAGRLALVLLLALGCQSGGDTKKGSASFQTHPGATAFPRALAVQLAEAVAAKGTDYEPRTRHKTKAGRAKYVNRLILSASPYLLQHAHNPVNWYPWGQEAFEAARKLGRPVLLSVGYSTCHWCHVMEEESFEDEEIAAYLNKNYIAIKVDRERRPDIDAIYMRAVQRLTGGGGWPMTVWLTPAGKPFFGGTYYPPRKGVRGASMGFLELLQKAKGAYDEDPSSVIDTADRLVADIARQTAMEPGESLPGDAVLAAAAAQLEARFDRVHGGLRTRRNKFPSSMPVRVLLRNYRRTKSPVMLEMAIKTLDHMRRGGLYDQVGGGFHRYSTDPLWLVPHFEKMLYDNALLVIAYLEAHQATGQERFADTVRDVLAYVSREMVAPEGGFYSATDADSLNPSGEREEGAFFVWNKGELQKLLGEDAAVVISHYGVTSAGNFEGHNILHVARPLAEVAAEEGIPLDRAQKIISRARATLLENRNSRPPPGLDDKILASWNGLMISAFARAARGLPQQRERYLAVAAKAAGFVLTKMRKGKRLLRSYHDGRAELDAYLEDYAFVIAGLLDLFETTSEPRYLDSAVELDSVLASHFEDEAGGFFRTAADAEKLLMRDKPINDGALPSGNSAQALNLLRLYELTSKASYLQRADRLLKFFAPGVTRAPTSANDLLLAVDFRSGTPKEIVIVSTDGNAGELDAVLSRQFVPNHVYVAAAAGDSLARIAERVPLVAHKVPQGGKATAYVCERQRCQLPTSDPKIFEKQIMKVTPMESSSGKPQ